MKTVTYDPAVYKLVPVESDDEMIHAAAESGNLFRVDAMRSVDAAIAVVPATLPGVVAHSGNPFGYGNSKEIAEATHDMRTVSSYKTGFCDVPLFDHPPAQPDTAALQARIAKLEAQDPFELVYCKLTGADSPHGLSSCDNFKAWKEQLAAQAGHDTLPTCHDCAADHPCEKCQREIDAPAPANSLVILPDALPHGEMDNRFQDGWNACRTAAERMNSQTAPATTLPTPEQIDYLITITCGGMTSLCKTPEAWALREKNMREFARLLLEDMPAPPITQPLIAEAAWDDVDWPAAMADARFVYEFLPDAISAIDYIQAVVDNQPKKAIAAVKRDDVAGDAARLSAIFAALPLDYFCAAFDVPPPPDNALRDFSVWAKSVIDAHIDARTKDVADWKPISAPGQVNVGAKLRFTIGDEKFSETAKQILNAGVETEEIIYNKRKNYYLITSMAIQNKGSQKNVEFLAASKKSP